MASPQSRLAAKKAFSAVRAIAAVGGGQEVRSGDGSGGRGGGRRRGLRQGNGVLVWRGERAGEAAGASKARGQQTAAICTAKPPGRLACRLPDHEKTVRGTRMVDEVTHRHSSTSKCGGSAAAAPRAAAPRCQMRWQASCVESIRHYNHENVTRTLDFNAQRPARP